MKFVCPLDVISAGLALTLLIFTIRNSRLFNFYDHWIHHKLVRHSETKIWQIITFLNEPKLIVLWDLILAGILFVTHHPYIGSWVILTLAFTDLLGILLKNSLKRKRPVNPKEARKGYSFPSGHVLSVTIMGLMLWRIFGKRGGLILFVGIMAVWILVALSRLNTRAHYPSDIIGATTLGIFCFTIAQQLLALV